jgi:signal transduction histidine kinase
MENLLEWSRAQTGAIVYKPESIKLKKLIDFNISLIKSRADQKNITVKSDVEDKLKAFADKNMVDFILRNLLSNAVKYTHQNGNINISAILNDDQVEISVKDDGIGIPADVKLKLFKSTDHVSTYGTENEKGTGLGLMLCKDFIKHNRGEIWLNSEVGKGTRVTFSLPRNR